MFTFLGKKRKGEILKNELFTRSWKKEFIEKNYNSIIEKYYKEENATYEQFIQLLSDKNEDIFLSKDFLAPFLTKEGKKEISNGLIKYKNEDFITLEIQKENKKEEIFTFFYKPKLLVYIFSQDSVEYNFLLNKDNFTTFWSSKNPFSIDYLEKNNLKTIYKVQNNVNFKMGKEKIYIFFPQEKEIEINFDTLKKENIFSKDLDLNSIIQCRSEEISPIFFYYNNIQNINKNEYIYFNTKKRKEVSNKLISTIYSYPNISFGITGGKGTGKSTFLYYLSSLHIFNTLYLNIHFFYRKPIYSTKIALKFEVFRLLSRYINSTSELESFYKLIDELNEEIEFFTFLNKFISILDNFVNREKKITNSFIIIIDQFSHEINNGEAKLRASIMKVCGMTNISIIFCSTLNKHFVNNYLLKTLKDNYNYTINLPIHYFSKLFSDEDMNNFIQKDEMKFKSLFRKFNLPYFYYFLKDNNYEINNFESMIKDELLSFYDIDDYFSKMIDLIDIVKNNYLITASKFINLLQFLPLKYLNIKKRQIDSNDFISIVNNIKGKDNLNILLLKKEFLNDNYDNSKNNEILENYFHCDEINDDLLFLIKKKNIFLQSLVKI